MLAGLAVVVRTTIPTRADPAEFVGGAFVIVGVATISLGSRFPSPRPAR